MNVDSFRLPLRLALLLALAAALTGCAASRTYVHSDYERTPPLPAADSVFQVFLVGNTALRSGEEPAPVLALLRERLRTAGPSSAVVFLGDVSRGTLPDSAAADRAEAEAPLRRLLEAVEGYEGRVVVVPGDRDWASLDALQRTEAFLEARLGGDVNVVLPDAGHPGPAELELAEDLYLVALNTQWWLADEHRPTGEAHDVNAETELDVLLALDDLLKRRDDERVLVVGHHPVYSNGPRGGNFTLRQHLFPLTDLWAPLVVPLPVVGSAYPLYRAFFGARQDLAHPEYEQLRLGLERVFEQHESLIYAAAHEHALQYVPQRGSRRTQHHLVSGGGARGGPVASGQGAAYADGSPGFMTLHYLGDDSVWMEAWTLDGGAPEGRLAFRTKLMDPRPERVDHGLPDDPAAYPDYTDSTVVIAADPSLAAGPIKRFFFGQNYRDVWTAPIALPMLDVGRKAGGLTPLQRGGGFQTTSLRMEGGDGHQYVLRLLEKDPSPLLPPELHGTVAADVAKDQISTGNPYAAAAVPPIARAAGIYYTLPEFVVVPDDPRLGVYRETFAGRSVLFEERAENDESERPNFGNSRDVVSTERMFRELREDNDHRIDQRFFVRSRLVDLLIGDWDRHEDQWRWGEFEPFEIDPTLTGEARTQGKVFRPIPRDRDQAFFRLTGLLPSIAKFFVPGFQDFQEDYGSVLGLTENSVDLDRRLTSELSRADWHEIAHDLQARLTDDVFREAIAAMPDTVQALHGERIFRNLRSRRDQLPEAADDFYELLAKVVDVVGTDKHERFVVNRLGRDSTEVAVHKINKEGEDRGLLYRRVFHHDETHELRLYGLGGQDRFEITGQALGGPYIRVVGGPGDDTFVNSAGDGRVRFYDTLRGNRVERGGARVTLSDAPEVNRYEYEGGYWHPFFRPLPFFGYNDVDGVFLGAGIEFLRSGFRKEPYGGSHFVAANISTLTAAVNARYRGLWIGSVGGWDLRIEGELDSPQTLRNYFGLGNETTADEDLADRFRLRLARAEAYVGLEREIAPGLTLAIGPSTHVAQVLEDGNRATLDSLFTQPGVTGTAFEDYQWYAGGSLLLELERTDRSVNPRQGFDWENRASLHAGLQSASDYYGTLASDLAVYLPIRYAPQLTLALRAGGAYVLGDFPFYEAATLGGTENLRGFRSTRFAGRAALYQSAELRLKLFSVNTYLLPAELGVLGLLDNGRVWTDGEDWTLARGWHQGYGGGLWLSLYNSLLVSGTVATSDEGTLVNVGLGFLF